MQCEACRNDIEYLETYYQMITTKEGVHDRPLCLIEYMLSHITSREIDECFSAVEFPSEKEQFRRSGLGGLSSEALKYLLEWYKDNFAFLVTNDEPDEKLIREWELERRYQEDLYSNDLI